MSLEKVSIHPDNCLYSEYFYSSLKTFHWLLLSNLDSQQTLTRASVRITSLFAYLHRNGSFVHLEERLLSAFGEMADRLFSSQGSGSPIQVLGDVDHKKAFPVSLAPDTGIFSDSVDHLVTKRPHSMVSLRFQFWRLLPSLETAMVSLLSSAMDYKILAQTDLYFSTFCFCFYAHFSTLLCPPG